MTEPVDPQQPQQPGWGGQPPMDKKQAKAQAAANKAYEKSNRNWFVRHKILSGLGALILLGVILSAASGGGSTDDTTNASDDATTEDADTTNKAPAAPAPAAEKAAPKVKYAGQLDDDKLAGGTGAPGGTVSLSGWTVSATALKKTSTDFSKNICTDVVMTNRDDKQQEYNGLSWKMQTPGGDVQDITFTGENDLTSGGLAPGGKVAKRVCFEDKAAGAGQYVLAWAPDIFSSKDRGIWLNKLAA